MAIHDAASLINAAKPLGSRLGLERIAKLCDALGNPQDSYPTVHVAGTNGKGSTAAVIAAAFSEAGYRTGLYTSPYLIDARECIQIDGASIGEDEFRAAAAIVAEKAEALSAAGESPTAFELETVIAFLWFRQRGCQAAVIEVGLGGRLDATNVIRRPAVSVITSISYDHVNILGDTHAKIATEKCGIIKPCGVTVSYPVQSPEAMVVIRARAGEEGCPLAIPNLDSLRILRQDLCGSLMEYDGLRLEIGLAGWHQPLNAITAVEAIRAFAGRSGLPVSDGAIIKGIASARLPMRQEVFRDRPLLLLDGAHNLDKLTALADTMKEHLAGRRTVVVMGMLRDKEFEPSIALIAGLCSHFVACAPQSERALDSETASAIAGAHCADVRIIDNVGQALTTAIALAGVDGAVVVCGSFYLAGPARGFLLRTQA